MKKILYSIIILSLFSFISCSDFLEQRSSGSIGKEQLADEDGINMLLAGMYASLLNDSYFEAPLTNYVYGDVIAGDANKGSTYGDQPDFTSLELYTMTVDNGYLGTKWVRVYDGVFRANELISDVESNKDALSAINGREKDFYTETVAQGRFMRGFFHFEGVKTFGAAIPYIGSEEFASNVNPKVSNVDESNNYIYIWDRIYEDLQYAYDNLPDAWPEEPGRVNKWAAAALLAKVKMYQSSPYNGTNNTVNRWGEVKDLLKTVIDNGKDSKGTKYRLADSYEALWTAGESDWTGESIFDIQMTIVGTNEMISCVNGGWHTAPPGGMGNSGWGFYQPSNDLVNAYIVDEAGLPYVDKSYRSKPALTKAGVDQDGKPAPNFPETDLTVYTDPRLDISVGRFHLPFWDWTVPTSIDGWVRDLTNGGYYMNKKLMPKKSDKGSLSNGTQTCSSAKNIHLIRYADVLLWYAEALIETGQHADALKYVNMVRERAAKSYVKAVDPATMLESTSNYVLDDKINNVTGKDAASNYRIGLYTPAQFSTKEKALAALKFERRLELALEGHRWYDLARWGNIENDLNEYVAYEKQYLNKFAKSNYNSKWVTLPIPDAQIVTMEGLLVQNPNWK
ncbi:RagB/SusD family nutrient uptake outer membrane protein [Dysgonomonas sp. Marseille-P4361]|uniref:RagB/SusD family nutrient uptake outer membrane protein n=1 Tax=Dysgonomonas sp. Marseille-P4361 TaxID=2161820 RepID=UPI000D5515C6|nr:RagB/SusD family nutrient uptake outer membrane protein [Dysgonomonas sp. Marseille-P4361]